MGIVLQFPLQPIDPERVRVDGDESCRVLIMPVKAPPTARDLYCRAMADLYWAVLFMSGIDPPHGAG